MGANKVLMFVKSVDRKERKAIGIHLEDDDGALVGKVLFSAIGP